jgi:hypothetical protein
MLPSDGGTDVYTGVVVLTPLATVTGAPTDGVFVRLGAVALAVRRIEFTDVAVAGTAMRASTWRGADPEVTVPMLQAAEPSPLHPKLNCATWPDGLADRWSVAPGTLPLSAQALTTHSAAWPCLMLVSSAWTLMHKLGTEEE